MGELSALVRSKADQLPESAATTVSNPSVAAAVSDFLAAVVGDIQAVLSSSPSSPSEHVRKQATLLRDRGARPEDVWPAVNVLHRDTTALIDSAASTETIRERAQTCLNLYFTRLRQQLNDVISRHDNPDRSILNSLAAPVILFADTGAVIDWNQAAVALFSWLQPGLPTDSRMLPLSDLVREMADTGRQTAELTLGPDTTGHTGPLIVRLKRATGDTGRNFTTALLLNTTLATRYRAVADHLPVSLYLVKLGSPPRFELANTAFLDLLGYQSLDHLIQAGVEAVHGDASWAAIVDVARQPSVPHRANLLLRRADGRPVWCAATITTVTDSGGQTPHLEVIAEDITGQVQAEHELRCERELVSMVVDNSASLIVMVDRLGRIVRFNPACERASGYAASLVSGRELAEQLVHPADRDQVQEVFQQLLSGTRTVMTETRWLTRDGDTRTIAWSYTRTRRGDGELEFVVAIGTDITRQRQTEAALQAETERLTVTLSSIGDGVIAVDNNSGVTLINPVACHLTGWEEIDALGRPLSEVFAVHPEDSGLPITDPASDVLTGSAGSITGRTVLQSRTGTRRIIANSAAQIRTPDGSMAGAIIVFRDITVERKREHELAESEALFRLLTENATDVIFRFRVDPEPRYEYVSPAIESLVGYTPEEICTDPELGWSIVHPDDRETLSAVVSSDFDFSRPLVARWLARDGRVIWTEQRLSPTFDGTGRLIMIDGIVRNITEQKELERRLVYLSLHDSLTGLYNRPYFDEELLRLDGGRNYPVTVIVSDLDRLKLINDTMGHQMGDRILKAYAHILNASFRRSDVVARIGGDEFGVILPGTDAESAADLQQRLERTIEEYLEANPGVPLSVSLGSATATGPDLPLEQTLATADQIMYVTKMEQATTASGRIVRAMRVLHATGDPDGPDHINRVRHLADRLGQSLGLSASQRNRLRLLAEVHDLGQVGVPDYIMHKPGRLTREERLQVTRHPLAGYRIARSSAELAVIADLVLHHHEWWNGNGYPTGLSGSDIPVECRILSVVDAFDAMIHDRPYRRAMPLDSAVAELCRLAGTQFDPDVVTALIALVKPD